MPKIIILLKNLEILLFLKNTFFGAKIVTTVEFEYYKLQYQKLQTFHLNILTKINKKIFWAQKVIFLNLNFSRQKQN